MRFPNPVTDDFEYSLKFTCCFRPKKNAFDIVWFCPRFMHSPRSLSFLLSLFVSWIPFFLSTHHVVAATFMNAIDCI